MHVSAYLGISACWRMLAPFAVSALGMAMHMRQHADTCTNMKIQAHVKILMRMYPQNGSKIGQTMGQK